VLSPPIRLIARSTFWPSSRTPMTMSSEMEVALRSSRSTIGAARRSGLWARELSEGLLPAWIKVKNSASIASGAGAKREVELVTPGSNAECGCTCH
jgi:hypothetical protein